MSNGKDMIVQLIAGLIKKTFSLKSNLANLKSKVDKLDIDKLTPVPDDLGKLSNVVKNDVVKKTAMTN